MSMGQCMYRIVSFINKREWLNQYKIQNYEDAYKLIFEYIETFYNTVRIHSHCNYQSPNQYEKSYVKSN
ncbi:MAG: IS3 family transposase [Catenibacterium sp.]|uniref:IS3 family transposase n=1 Tax=Catenibacterium sp. TaxID=2049022 RepID=UPI00399613CE